MASSLRGLGSGGFALPMGPERTATAMSMQWYPTSPHDYDMLKGYAVYTSDNARLGSVEEIYHPAEDMPDARGHSIFKVNPGILREVFTHAEDLYIPERLIQSVDTQFDKIILDVSKDAAQQQDWSRPENLDTFHTL